MGCCPNRNTTTRRPLTIEPVLVAALVLYVWRRLGLVAAAWAALMPVFLVAASWHVPSDVAGGVLFGLVAVFAAYAVIAALSARRA